MGFGDPYHKHPLRVVSNCESAKCYHCDLPFIGFRNCVGCRDCDYYIHQLCQDLPIKLRVPLHDQHLLTLFESPSSSSSSPPNLLCNECQNPCVGRFSYQCITCQFLFHLKCLFTIKHEKHEHPLIFRYAALLKCKICGYGIRGFAFGCSSCNFYIHQECSLIPLEIKHHHVHKLILRHNFPEECDQVYCDLCEDKDGEMDRSQSYYYCKDCDYIAHVWCCLTQLKEDVFSLCQRFTHEHLLRPNHTDSLLSCTQCSYTISHRSLEYPSLVKHPRHPDHTFLFDLKQYCFNCTDCNFSMERDEFNKFTHPLRRDTLEFICENNLFRCDACGGLGKGSRIRYQEEGEFDLHLECFSLPGKLEQETHPNHPLYLRWLCEISTSRNCSVCTKEIDPQLWFYFCQECNYAAHIDCVARDLLSTLRSSIKNQSDFCAIIESEESSFKYRIADKRPRPDVRYVPSYSRNFPLLQVKNYDKYDDNDEDDGDADYDEDDQDDDDDGNCDLRIETTVYGLACPKCNSLIATQVGYSTIDDWKSSFLKDRIETANDRTLSGSEPLNFLDEQIVDELCCSICNISIFPPTYSCASCQIYFHKSCAELPRKILFNETTYVLTAPPLPEGLSGCTKCKYPVSSFAYISPMAGLIFDVHCAAGAPLVNRTYCKHTLFSLYIQKDDWECRACKTGIEIGKYMIQCGECYDSLPFPNCYDSLHLECGLLPAVIKHRIHQHPLELATDLAKLDCEYFCDVCEKDLNPDVWAYRCVDWCGFRAVSHVSCVITSKKKCHFSQDIECQTWTEEKKHEFRENVKKRGMLAHIEENSEDSED